MCRTPTITDRGHSFWIAESGENSQQQSEVSPAMAAQSNYQQILQWQLDTLVAMTAHTAVAVQELDVAVQKLDEKAKKFDQAFNSFLHREPFYVRAWQSIGNLLSQIGDFFCRVWQFLTQIGG